jgi:hypothetical protein
MKAGIFKLIIDMIMIIMIMIVTVKWRTAETHMPGLIQLRPEILRV